MTVFNDTYDTATPAGSDDPAEADDRMREIKAALQERLNVNMYFPLTGTEVSDADAGETRMLTIRTLSAAQVAALTATKAYLYRLVTDGELYFKDASNNTIKLTVGGILNSLNLTGAQTVAGVKTFSSIPEIPTTAPTADAEAAGKKYVDDQIAANAEDSDSIIKAWGNAQSDGTLLDSFNVTSVVRDTTGKWTITWATDFANANYACVIVPFGDTTAAGTFSVSSQQTGTAVVRCRNTSNNLVNSAFNFIAIGDQ